jgi:hypothetical protein
MPSKDVTFRPHVSALVLLLFLALALSGPMAVFLTSVAGGTATRDELLVANVIAAPLCVLAAIWIYRANVVVISGGKAVFVFTRFGVRRSATLSNETLRSATFLPGTLSVDGRPLPRIEYELANGHGGWIPLTLYTRRQNNALLSELRALGLEVAEI